MAMEGFPWNPKGFTCIGPCSVTGAAGFGGMLCDSMARREPVSLRTVSGQAKRRKGQEASPSQDLVLLAKGEANSFYSLHLVSPK